MTEEIYLYDNPLPVDPGEPAEGQDEDDRCPYCGRYRCAEWCDQGNGQVE